MEAAHHAFSEGARDHDAYGPSKMLRRPAEVLAEHSEPLGRCEQSIRASCLRKRAGSELHFDFFQYYAGLADKVTGETLPIDKPDMMTMTVREPLGVVAVVPWNSQLFSSP